jgi:hypothetical protein
MIVSTTTTSLGWGLKSNQMQDLVNRLCGEVGIRDTALTSSSSTLTCRKTAAGYFLAQSAYTGAIALQPGHQEVMKSMIT